LFRIGASRRLSPDEPDDSFDEDQPGCGWVSVVRRFEKVIATALDVCMLTTRAVPSSWPQ
jgi:hypothetical protein